MSDRAFLNAYDAALSLPRSEAEESPRDGEAGDASNPKTSALRRAHDLRKFEIENYWKRATYFWAFQVAAFALFGLIWKGVGTVDRLALLVPAGLGAISAQVGWLTARGSKFWQENWEAHVDLLEQNVEGRMTQAVLSKGGPQYSVSRVNQNFMCLLMSGWVAAFVIILCEPLEAWLRPNAQGLALAALAASMLGLAAGSRTKLAGWRYADRRGGWEPLETVSVWRWFYGALLSPFLPSVPEIILRDTLSGRSEDPSQVANDV